MVILFPFSLLVRPGDLMTVVAVLAILASSTFFVVASVMVVRVLSGIHFGGRALCACRFVRCLSCSSCVSAVIVFAVSFRHCVELLLTLCLHVSVCIFVLFRFASRAVPRVALPAQPGRAARPRQAARVLSR